MNTIYRLVWNATLQTWVVASEFASAKGKGKNGTTRRAMIRAGTMASAFAATLLTAGPAQAWVVNPTSVQNGGTSASDGGVSTNTAIGTASVASGAGNAIAIGAATAAGQNDIAIGNGATTFGGQANVVVGMNAKSTNATDSVALGNSSYVQGKGAVAAGLSSYAVGDYSQAIGASARSTASYSSALGFDAQATASGGMALGYSSRVTATAANGIAIGKNASVSGTNSVALGAGAVSDNSTITSPAYNPTSTFTLSGTVPVGEVSLGTANNERRITNVGAGAKATDAVNVSQLQSAAASLTSTVAAAKTHYVSINDNGTVGANYNNDGAGGSGSMAIGVGAVTSGTESLAMGLNASAKGSSDLVLGRSASSAYSSQGSVVLGNQAKAGMATGGIAVGALSFVQGMNGVAMGSSSYGGGNYSLALGASAQTNADYSNAIGYDAQAAAQGGLALGQSTRITSTGANGTAIGRNASVSGGNSVALGAGSVSDNSTMASAAYNPYTSFTLAGATPVGEVSIGTAGNERRITNVAAGSQNTDAVNVSQLKSTTGQIDINTANIATNKTNIATNTTNIATNTSNIATNTTNIANNTTAINSLQDDALQWDATLNAFSANHLGAGPATITNVAPGQLSATSTDAVNGSQLNDTNNLVSTNTTDIATNTANIATNTTNIANNTVKIDGLKDDALQWDATLGAFSANHMSNGSSKITNVAAGDVSATSSDAVNGSQLFQIAGDTSNTYITSNGTGVKYVRTNSSGLAESDAYAHGEGSTAIGYMASTDINAISALAMGNGATASVKDGVALGSGSVATTAAGIAGYMPTGASAAQIAAIAATTSTLGGVSVGDADNGQFRQINGVAAGTAASDAVNVAQLQASIGDSTADTVLYDSSAHNQVTLGGVASTTPVSLTNVAAGNLSATSTDAVNGSQLNATNDQVATNTTNIATNTANIAGNTTDIANNTVKIDGLQEDALQWDATANGGNGAYSANHLGAGPNKLTNVAAGELSATSTDAVNGSQLNATNDQVATNTTDIANNATNITHLGDEISNVYDTGTKYFHANSTGTDSVASGVDAVAIGMGAIASADNSVALGAGSLADGSTLAHQAYLVGGTATGEVNVGDRRITGLSAGADNTDAVNVAQLQAVTASSVADAVMYDGSSHNRITLGGNSYNSSTHTGGATITNVADGVAPSDAVNFSQLTDTNNQVATNTTNIANNTANIAGNTTDIANNTVKIDGLQEDALQWDATANGGNGAYSANHLGAGPNKLTNVAAGELSATSTDAVNGSQLNATNDQVATNTTNIATNTANIAGNTTDIANNTVKIDGLQEDALQWDATANGGNGAYSANHLGAGPNKLTNVAAGELSATSTDAVNGSQLNATNDQVATNTTNIANNTANIATNTTDIANNTVKIDGLQEDALQWDATANGGNGAYSANHLGAGPNKLTNVAAGELSATSTDAVNGSQLNATNDQVVTNTTDIANNATNITHLGDEISNVYDTGTKYFHANSTGTDSVASGVDAVAIGMGAIASADNSVALGAGSLADGSTLAHQAYLVGGTAKGEVNVGDRRITGLSAGADDMDAVNVAQLQAVAANSVADAVMYDGSNHNRITLGGNSYNSSTHTGGATITNVADGVAPSDAVNFSHLTNTNNQVATNTTNIATNTANIAGNTTDIANNTVKIDGLQEDALQWDATANGGNGAYSANHLGAGPNKLTNVAAGELSATSTDAVNGSQLNATNDQVATNTTNIATNTANIAGNTTDIANNTVKIDGLQEDALQWDATANGGNGAYSANHLGAGPNKLTNVAAGELSATSTDAVNGSQLNATNDQVATNTTDIANNATNITHLGDEISNVYDTGTKYFHANSTGTDSVASGVDAVAIGMGAIASADNSVALGAGSLADGSTLAHQAYLVGGTAKGEVNVGDRRITGLSAGADDMDAVNVAQLKQVTSGAVADAVIYDNTGHNTISLSGSTYKTDTHTGGTVITNVGNGEISSTSSDAVNGSQLNDTNQQVSTNTTSIANNTTNIANNTVKIDGLKDDALQWDATANGGNGAYSANHLGAGPSKLTNVAAGELSTTSTDAVNGSQLNATNDQVATNTTNIATNTSDIANNATNITNLGDEISNVYDTGTKYFHANSTGTDSSATGVDAIAIGMGAVANVNRSIALGDGAKTAAAVGTTGTTIRGTQYAFAGTAPVGTLSVGDVGAERTITNVAAGSLSATSTDAVNGSQLFASNQAIDSITTNIDDLGGRAVKYDLNADGTVNHDKITLAGAPTRITNVAAGNLSATSTDAVNGSQLNATNQQVSINTSNIATNTTDIANNTVKIDGLKDDALQWDATANGGNGAYSANHLGAGPSKLTNVAAGELSTTSTDAVNGSQLNATNEQINTNTVNINGLKQDALLWDSHLGAFSASHGALAVNKITNVARGELSKNSTDAVNGSQLYETNMNVSNLENTINNLKPTDVKYLKVNSTGAGSVATGSEAIAIGANAVASGDNSIASGNGAVSSGIGSIAMGNNTTASGEGSIATGNNAKASGKDSTAIGNGAASTASNSVALGANSLADRDNSVSVGSAGHERQITNLAAGKEDTDAVNVAQLREVSGDVTNVSNAITKISNGTDGMFQVNNTDNLSKPTVTGKNALAGGAGSTASGDNSMTVGTQARSAGTDSVALGNSSSATGRNSVALGTNSTADRDNTVSVGSIGGERQIANVAAGTNGTDAVNVNQLNSGINSSYQYTDNKFNSLKNMIDDNKDKMSAGVAGAMAMASLPQPYAPGASMVSMGGGTYQNQSAVALGVSAISENGKWVTKVAGTSNTQGDFGASVGVGYQW